MRQQLTLWLRDPARKSSVLVRKARVTDSLNQARSFGTFHRSKYSCSSPSRYCELTPGFDARPGFDHWGAPSLDLTVLLTVAPMIQRDKEPPTWTLRWSVFTPTARLQFKDCRTCTRCMDTFTTLCKGHAWNKHSLCFYLLFISLPDQQRLVFHFTTHLHVPVPPVCEVFQQRHLLNMDSPRCSG